MKIIYIITFPPAYHIKNADIKPDHYWTSQMNEMIGVWRRDRGHAFARDVKRLYPEIDYEVWRPDYRAKKELVHRFEDGVVHRTFPARKRVSFFGLKPIRICYSRSLILKLEESARQAQDTRDVVIHLPVDYSHFGYLILKRFHGRLPFLHTSHLAPEALSVDLKTKNIFKYLHRRFIQRRKNRHKKMLGEIAVAKDRIEYFKKETGSPVHLINSLNQFDFEWAKNKPSREEARKRLSLPASRFILFSSSRLIPEKQVDRLLHVLASLKHHDYLYIISGNGTLEYEEYLKKMSTELELSDKVVYSGYLDDQLLDHYCAADAFIYTSWNEGGPGAGVKALALEVPVIATNTGIVHYLLKEKKAGLILEKDRPETWAGRIEEVMNGLKIQVIDSQQLEKEYGLKQFTRRLVDLYGITAKNFYLDA